MRDMNRYEIPRIADWIDLRFTIYSTETSLQEKIRFCLFGGIHETKSRTSKNNTLGSARARHKQLQIYPIPKAELSHQYFVCSYTV